MQLIGSLANEFTRFTEIRRRLIEADPQIDETALLDTLEGATSLHEAIGEVIRAALYEEALADGLKGRLEKMKEGSKARFDIETEKKEVKSLTFKGGKGGKGKKKDK